MLFIIGTIAIGFIFGFVAQRSDFCLHGILSEHVLMKTSTKIGGLLALWLTFVLVYYPLAFIFDIGQIPPTGLIPARASHIVGGLVLGFGSVFAGG